MTNEDLASAFEKLAAEVQAAPIIGQKIVVHAGQSSGTSVGLSINVTGGTGSGDVIGQRISVSNGQNDGLVQELQEAAQMVRAGNAPKGILRSLVKRVSGALGDAAMTATATGLLASIGNAIG